MVPEATLMLLLLLLLLLVRPGLCERHLSQANKAMMTTTNNHPGDSVEEKRGLAKSLVICLEIVAPTHTHTQ